MTDEFCSVLAQILAENKTIGRSGKQFTNLTSNSTLNNLRFIQQTMRDRKPKRTLEIGLAFGASALVFCSEHQRLGHKEAKQHVAIDPYQPYPTYLRACSTMVAGSPWTIPAIRMSQKLATSSKPI